MITKTLYKEPILIDTSAVIALHEKNDSLHSFALEFFNAQDTNSFIAIDCTTHECYTRVRYIRSFQSAWEQYKFIKTNDRINVIRFQEIDECQAEKILKRYSDHKISFHDALCAAVMKRINIYNIFTFDRDFYILGFAVLPGITR